MSRSSKVKNFYTKLVQEEWDRLVHDPFHKLELDTTYKYIDKYFPQKGLILDAGGGPGRYTIELAKKGYQVVLLDYVRDNLVFADEKIKENKVQDSVKDVILGSIVDLSAFPDNSFDAVICLGGPLSHVHTAAQRSKAVRELLRVARIGAPVYISVMGKIGNFPGIAYLPNEVELTKHFRDFWVNGEDEMFGTGANGYAHYFTKEELAKLVIDNGAELITTVGLESFATPVERPFNEAVQSSPRFYKNWIEMHYSLCETPSAIDASGHILVIAKKVQ